MKIDPLMTYCIQPRHNRRSIRLKEYDYSQPGWYFITICSQNRDTLFGDVIDGKMVLNDAGEIVNMEWQKTAEIRKNIIIDQYAIMPNHLHGIIGIVDEEDIPGKGTMHRAPTIEQYGKPTSNSIPTIIRGFKSAVTKKINIKNNTPGAPVWQRNYYERIIRDDPELNRIRKYINENPFKWQIDKYFSNANDTK